MKKLLQNFFTKNSYLPFFIRNMRGDEAKEKCPDIVLVKGEQKLHFILADIDSGI